MRENDDERMSALADQLLAELLRLDPVAATLAGEHAHDGVWPDLSRDGELAERAFITQAIAALEALAPDTLSVQARIDREIALNHLRYRHFALEALRDAERNPLLYTRIIGDGLDPLLTRTFATQQARADRLADRLASLPALIDAAISRLISAPRIHVETALSQNQGLIALCDEGLSEMAAAASDAARFALGVSKARAALGRYQVFLETELLPRSTDAFRMGRALFEKTLRHELDDEIDVDALAAEARLLLHETRLSMFDTACELWDELLPGETLPDGSSSAARDLAIRCVLEAIAVERPSNETIVADATRLLDEATRFVRERALIGLPSESCRIIEMPEYRRGVAIAYCDSSGPLEQDAETFFAISPTPSSWPAERVASFYREYNTAMLADLVVHEAMPGHFLQLMYNNRFASKLRAVFASGAFIEGWAVYTEWLMARHGFGGARVKMMQQKMLLRVAVNALLDHGVHAGAMTEQEALSLMTEQAFQEEGEAVGKWRRAMLTGAQLSTYFYGYTQMRALRTACEAMGDFDERAFHAQVLAHGSPSMRHVRTLLLGLASSRSSGRRRAAVRHGELSWGTASDFLVFTPPMRV